MLLYITVIQSIIYGFTLYSHIGLINYRFWHWAEQSFYRKVILVYAKSL